MTICRPAERPDLKQIVDRTMALFAVYTAATLSFFVKDFLFSDANLQKYTGLTDWLHAEAVSRWDPAGRKDRSQARAPSG